MCPGRHLAESIVKSTIALLLYHYEMELVVDGDMPRPELTKPTLGMLGPKTGQPEVRPGFESPEIGFQIAQAALGMRTLTGCRRGAAWRKDPTRPSDGRRMICPGLSQ